MPDPFDQTLNAQSQNQLTRVGFYFGFEIFKKLGVLIRLVQAFFSATPIQAWMPKDATEAIRIKLDIPPDWNETPAIGKPAVQFDDKIDPIAPFAFRGVIWYQRERNAKT